MKVGFVLAILAGLVLSFAAESLAYIIPYENAEAGKEILVVYTVKEGDSLEKIARFHGVEEDRIVEMNKDKIAVQIHKVKKGEWLSKIARLYGTTWQKIFEMNRDKINDPEKIYPGQRLKMFGFYIGQRLIIPLGIFWDKVIEHEVKKGEYPLYIARKYAAFPEQIFHDNKLTSKDLIYPGQILKVATVRVPKKKVIASWYGKPFHGRKAANGEKFDMNGLTVAHRFLPLGMKLKVSCRWWKSLKVEVTDRGPWVLDRQIDLSYKIAEKFGKVREGVFEVTIKSE